MAEDNAASDDNLIAMTVDLAAAYVSNNRVAFADLPAIINSIHAAITGLTTGAPMTAVAPTTKLNPAQIRQSITPDALISFLDGKPYKTLKRHLTSQGLTPERYRERYGLPADYPMVCPSYSEQRSSLAKSIGLGVPGARAAQMAPKAKGRRKAA